MCCDAPSPPDMTATANATAEAAALAKQSADQDLAFRKQVYTENAPRVQQLYDMANRVAQQQLGISNENQDFARSQQAYYKNTFVPNEMQTVADAYGASYLSDADRAQLNSLLSGQGGGDTGARMAALQALGIKAENAAGSAAAARAGGEVNAAFGQQARQLGRLGAGDPQRMALMAAKLGQQQTLARVGAANQAREAVRGQLMGLRTGVANFGRNMPNTAGQAFGLATQAGSSGVANQNTAANAGLPYAQFQAGGYGAGLGAAGLQQQGALGLAGAQNNAYATQAGIYGSQMQGLGSLAGTAAGLYLFSDRQLKSDVVFIGKHPKHDIGVYEYTLFGRRERGVMADEVERVLPHAVKVHESGYKLVNYAELE